MDSASQSPLLTKKQRANLDYAYKWFSRAQKDFNAFKRMVKFTDNKILSCTDPALSVYLLQQSIEKATKAVAVATGRYSYRRLISQGHNSLAVLLDFYRETLKTLLKKSGSISVAGGFGIDLTSGLGKIDNLLKETKKTPKDRIKDEVLYREQFATTSAESLDKILDMLINLRDKAFVGTLRSVFGPHGKIAIDVKKINTKTTRKFVVSLLGQVQKKMNLPKLTDVQLEAMISYVNMMAPDGISNMPIPEKAVIERRQMEEQQLGNWALLALFLLATFTFPHESTSRYPGPRKKKGTEINGCEDYSEKLGIINKLGKIAHITMLVFSELKTQLEAISASTLWNST